MLMPTKFDRCSLLWIMSPSFIFYASLFPSFRYKNDDADIGFTVNHSKYHDTGNCQELAQTSNLATLWVYYLIFSHSLGIWSYLDHVFLHPGTAHLSFLPIISSWYFAKNYVQMISPSSWFDCYEESYVGEEHNAWWREQHAFLIVYSCCLFLSLAFHTDEVTWITKPLACTLWGVNLKLC